jgi:hypothetical protein
MFLTMLLVAGSASCAGCGSDDQTGCDADAQCRGGRLCIDGRCEGDFDPAHVDSNVQSNASSTATNLYTGANNTPRVCATGANCADADCDGHGIGDSSGCRRCVEQAQCETDCDDLDAAVAPSLAEICDGKDNDCDGEVDELLSCEEAFDCPAASHPQGSLIPTCEAGSCVYNTPLNSVAAGDPACDALVRCVDGEFEMQPDACF